MFARKKILAARRKNVLSPSRKFILASKIITAGVEFYK